MAPSDADSAGGGDVVVVTGAGDMGVAIARRLGTGRTTVLADLNQDLLDGVVADLADHGFEVRAQRIDVSDRASVEALAASAAELGSVTGMVHTAGVSPVTSSTETVLAVDVVGTALVLEVFERVIAPGGAGVVIASMAGSMASLDPVLEAALATTPADDLLAMPELDPAVVGPPEIAYMLAKRANQVRVQAASVAWGRRGARLNSVSPGIIATAMGNAELAGPAGEVMRLMVQGSGTGRVGAPDEIASAVAFLMGGDASFVTGTDLLVDGGVTGSLLAPASDPLDALG